MCQTFSACPVANFQFLPCLLRAVTGSPVRNPIQSNYVAPSSTTAKTHNTNDANGEKKRLCLICRLLTQKRTDKSQVRQQTGRQSTAVFSPNSHRAEYSLPTNRIEKRGRENKRTERSLRNQISSSPLSAATLKNQQQSSSCFSASPSLINNHFELCSQPVCVRAHDDLCELTHSLTLFSLTTLVLSHRQVWSVS